MQKSNLFSTLAIIISLVALGILLFNFNQKIGPQLSPSLQQEIKNIKQSTLWNYQFTDALTSERFVLSDYEGKTMLIESSSPSCPQCVKQQNQILSLKEDLGESILIVSFIVDSEQKIERVQQYAQDNGFYWNFVVSKEANDILRNNFGEDFLTFSSNPIKIACPDGRIISFESGIKSSSEIKANMNSC